MKKSNIEECTLVSVKCDRCGKECKNTHYDITSRMRFCDTHTLIETVCFECYGRVYRSRAYKREKEIFNEMVKKTKEKK